MIFCDVTKATPIETKFELAKIMDISLFGITLKNSCQKQKN